MGDLAMSKDIIFVGFISAMLLGFLVTILFSFKLASTIWIWLSMAITVNSLTVMAAFSYWEYKKTIEMRCYQGIDQNSCGGERSSFFYLLIWVFGIAGAAYLCAILFYFRKILLVARIFRRATFLYRRTWQMKSIVGIGALSTLFISFFFLFTMIAASSYGPN